jgi:hypothetical protein
MLERRFKGGLLSNLCGDLNYLAGVAKPMPAQAIALPASIWAVPTFTAGSAQIIIPCFPVSVVGANRVIPTDDGARSRVSEHRVSSLRVADGSRGDGRHFIVVWTAGWLPC